MRRHPERVAAFLLSDPARLDPTRMAPEAALQAAEILTTGGEAFKALELLRGVHARWAHRGDVSLAYARALLHLGQWPAIPGVLAPLLKGAPSSSQAYAHYLMALTLGERPASSENDAAVIEHLEATLAIDPTFRSADGHDAADLRATIERIKAPKRAPGRRP